MPKFSFSAHPYLLGFDALEQMLESSAKINNDGYPPYNIEQRSEDHFRIILAVAGFAIEDLSVVVEGPKLVISGEQTQVGTEFLHQGIAARQFTRVFVLADCIETIGSKLENGLLIVDLRRISGNQAVRQIKIS
ncbi:MAG: heat-shock protein Hsp20 [Rhodobacteraceae bacterium]|nr:MAG: heat-shock protein Hsp20 [Paracoccaceae bacterium]